MAETGQYIEILLESLQKKKTLLEAIQEDTDTSLFLERYPPKRDPMAPAPKTAIFKTSSGFALQLVAKNLAIEFNNF